MITILNYRQLFLCLTKHVSDNPFLSLKSVLKDFSPNCCWFTFKFNNRELAIETVKYVKG